LSYPVYLCHLLTFFLVFELDGSSSLTRSSAINEIISTYLPSALLSNACVLTALGATISFAAVLHLGAELPLKRAFTYLNGRRSRRIIVIAAPGEASPRPEPVTL